jgi:hypothetical protein
MRIHGGTELGVLSEGEDTPGQAFPQWGPRRDHFMPDMQHTVCLAV